MRFVDEDGVWEDGVTAREAFGHPGVILAMLLSAAFWSCVVLKAVGAIACGWGRMLLFFVAAVLVLAVAIVACEKRA